MSDEELDDARKLVSSDHNKECDMRYAACKCGYEASLEAAVPYLIARLDAAERERDALREAQSGIEARVAAECDRLWRIAIWNEHKRRGTRDEWAMREVNEYADARAALTANHSVPVVEE